MVIFKGKYRLSMTDEDKAVEEKYAGRFFYKKVRTLYGKKEIIRIDKIERTRQYKRIRKELELLVAERFTGDKNSYYKSYFDESLQLMDYAFICDKCYLYYIYKQDILQERFGIDYLCYTDLNPTR
ncbi:MAG: hypothetical protein IJV72_03065 [Clostridia bacterium]|nr:hypothetical protein [Clostridia bacterium]